MQVRTCAPSAPLMEQSSSVSVQWTRPCRAGCRSAVTFFAVPRPMFSTRIVNVAVSPALICPLLGVLVTLTSGHRTVTSADAVSVPSLVVVALPVLSTVPQLAGSSGW